MIRVVYNGEAIADPIDVQLPEITPERVHPEKYLNLNGSFSFSLHEECNAGIERMFNYFETVPPEWDLFIHQCLEKWPVV